MPKRSTVLKELLRQRHWQTYATFCRQYDDAALSIDPVLVGHWPSRGQFARWLSGDIKGLPHPDHCRVLEGMFPGRTVQQLFAFPEPPLIPSPTPSPELPGRLTAVPDRGAAGQAMPRPSSSLPPGPDLPGGSPYPGTGSFPAAGSFSEGGPFPGAGSFREERRFPEAGPFQGDRSFPAHGSYPGSGSSQGPGSFSGSFSGPGGGPDPFFPGAASMHRSAYALPEEVALTTEESARFVRGTRGGVDHDVLDQLNADVRQLAGDFLARPPLTLFRPLSRLRAEVFEMLDRRQRPGLLPPLYAVAGRLCALLAHASADLGHSYPAETHTRTAWLCADLADDDSLRAYIRWVQSNVAYWDGDYRQAAQIAFSGQRYATKGSNLLRLASQEARAWAACGEKGDSERALAVATDAREQHFADDQAGVFRFDPGKAAYYASEIRLALGGTDNAKLAVQNAQDALTMFEHAPASQHSPEFVAAAQLDLANAYLALNDLDAAAEQLRIVLRLPVENRTQPIVGRVSAGGETLRSPLYARSAPALELREEIALFRAYPARRDLWEALG